MFKGRGKDMELSGLFSCQSHPLYRPVVPFTAPGSEKDFLRQSSQTAGNAFSGLFQRRFGLPPQSVEGGGVAVLLGKVGELGFQHRRVDRGGGGVVGVDERRHKGHPFRRNLQLLSLYYEIQSKKARVEGKLGKVR